MAVQVGQDFLDVFLGALVGLLVELHGAQARENPRAGGWQNLAVGETEELDHLGLFDGRATPQLTVGDVEGDGVTFGDGVSRGAIAGLECRHLAQRELLQEGGRLVGGPEHEAGGVVAYLELEFAVFGRDEDLVGPEIVPPRVQGTCCHLARRRKRTKTCQTLHTVSPRVPNSPGHLPTERMNLSA
uniref:Putative secreted protein n=1 Tax=Ixodes ricinus TaxID=34613 RepID=A0A6B0V0F8_IXORI